MERPNTPDPTIRIDFGGSKVAILGGYSLRLRSGCEIGTNGLFGDDEIEI
jgi:hypothetical protein